jgi:hypothetical protein
VLLFVSYIFCNAAGITQSVYFLTTDWTTRVRSPAESKFPGSNLCPGDRLS